MHFLRRAAAALADRERDLVLLAGLGLAGYGAAQIFLPAGFLLPGAVLVYVAIFGVR